MNNPQPVRVRFAPSPTGHTHLGSGRTALYDYLLARQTGGKFILRIEDSDQRRYVPGAEEELMNTLRWLGLEWDEGPDVGGPFGPYRQSERKEIYLDLARKLIKMGKAYYCFCSSDRLDQVRKEQIAKKMNPRYDRTCRHLDPEEAEARVARGERFVVRFKIPDGGSITARDLLRGDITVDNSALDDSIIVRSDGLALYHLAAMADDHLMNISHVIRGSEWLPTFPLHAHIIRAFGWEAPIFVHLSVFLKPSGKGKMSKRESADLIKDGYSIFLKDMQDLGYLPEAVREFFPFFLVIFTFYSLFGLIKCTKIFFWRLKDKSFTKIALNVFVLLFVLQSVQLLLYYKFSLSAWYLIVLVASMILIEPMAGAIALGISGMRSVKKHFGIAGLFISLISLKDVGYIIIVGAGFIVSGLLGYVPF